jgi:tetratricopeptide (TPR) repeat protein
LRQQGADEAAEEPLARAIECAEAIPGQPELAAEAWNNFGVLCKYAGWFNRGAAAYARSMAFAERMPETFGRNILIATILHNTGGLDHARGRFESAEGPARRAWEMRREHLGEEHPVALADAVPYAGVLDGLKRFAEARPIYERALGVYEHVFGPEHYETAATLHNLAFVEYAEGNRSRAMELARRACVIKEKLLGADHLETALSGMNLASLLPPEGSEEARVLLADALRVFEHALAADHPHTARCRQLLNRAEHLFPVNQNGSVHGLKGEFRAAAIDRSVNIGAAIHADPVSAAVAAGVLDDRLRGIGFHLHVEIAVDLAVGGF